MTHLNPEKPCFYLNDVIWARIWLATQTEVTVRVMPMTQVPGPAREITAGQLAARSGVTVSALHFYEAQGLICAAAAIRSAGPRPGRRRAG